MTLLGAHVDQLDPIAGAQAIGADVVQITLGDPQSWAAPSVAYPGGAAALRAALEAAGVAVYVHAPYVINVASPNNRIRVPGRRLLNQTVRLAGEIGARGVVVHGGHVTAGTPAETGYANWAKAVADLDESCPVLIENTAGGKHAMARTPAALANLWNAVGASGVGFCFDTCHAWAGGMTMPEAVTIVREITGRIDLVHANDSRGGLDSGVDRHATFGTGTIQLDALLDAIALADAPAVICETPPQNVAADITLIRNRLGQRETPR